MRCNGGARGDLELVHCQNRIGLGCHDYDVVICIIVSVAAAFTFFTRKLSPISGLVRDSDDNVVIVCVAAVCDGRNFALCDRVRIWRVLEGKGELAGQACNVGLRRNQADEGLFRRRLVGEQVSASA